MTIADPVRTHLARGDRGMLVLAATILASSLSFIDGSVINVGLPAIGAAFGGGHAGLAWVIDAYLLPLSALVLLGGAFGDRFGRRRVFALGIGLFGLSSAACAAAPTLEILLVGRIAQGLGAAMLMPNSLAILSEAFDGPMRGRAIGAWAAIGAATAGLGPVLGGWLIHAVGWRSIFLVNLPIAAAALFLTRYVRATPHDTTRTIDWLGGLLATAGLCLMTSALVLGSGTSGWTGPASGLLGAGVVALAGLWRWEGAIGDDAMMPLRLFGSRSFVALTLLTLLLYGALGALFVLLPFAMMRAGGASPVSAGASLLPVTILLATLSSPFGEAAVRFGARPLLAAGTATVAVGLLLLTRLGAASPYWTGLFPALALVGVGLAAAVAPLTTAVLASVESRLAGTASGFNNAVARTGGLMATACLGTALAASGEDLVEIGHRVAACAAVACLLAAGSALLLPPAQAVKLGGSS